MNLEAVRAFVTVAEEGQFQLAADHLAISQQAVSKRLAALEAGLGVRLLNRSAGGTRLTIDGQAFLPHARELLRAEQRAADSVRPGRRALRLDVMNYRTAFAAVVRDFHHAYPDIALDLVTIADTAQAAIAAIEAGTIDASFRAVGSPVSRLPAGIEAMPAVDEAHQLFTGPAHPLASARSVTPAELNAHPALTTLRDHLDARRARAPVGELWMPAWARRPRQANKPGQGTEMTGSGDR
jgi:DNA-binding transcriptional LysR family regulator